MNNHDFNFNVIHILVVDDHEINLMILVALLHTLGAKVSQTDRGSKAISLAKITKFDLVLLDIQMPELDGLETATELRKINYSNPIIAVSGEEISEKLLEKLKKSGIQDYISKPFEAENLKEKIIAQLIDLHK